MFATVNNIMFKLQTANVKTKLNTIYRNCDIIPKCYLCI